MKNKLHLLLFILISSLGVNAQWTKVAVSTTKNINALTFPSSSTIIAVGDSGLILRSQNTGNTFAIVASSTLKNLNDVFFLDANNGFIVGDGGTILKTINAGISWSPVTSNSVNDLNAIEIKNNIGIVVGSNGTILKSANNGAAWTALTPFTIFLLNKVHFVNNNFVVAAGSNGLILKSVDAGYNWTTVNSVVNKTLNDFAFYPDDTTMIFVGNSGLKIDADTSFSDISESNISSQWINAIHHLKNNDTCFAVGKNATVLFTTNSSSWNTLSINSTNDFNDISFVNDTTGIIVGSKGSIYKTITGGVSNGVNEIERLTFSLYPNPSSSFVNITRIFEGQAQLRIFNTSGQIITEKTIQGSNLKVQHDLPSGMYILQIVGNNSIGSAILIVE